MASVLAQLKALMVAGATFDVTNHYITRPEHSSFGTTRRTVRKVNTSSYYLPGPGKTPEGHPDGWPAKWPKASQVQVDADGTIRMYGGGAGQQPGDLFLTLVPVRPGDRG